AAGRLLYEGSGNVLQESAGMTFDGTTLSVTSLNNTGNTTLGDAAADTLTINAGTWTYGANYSATRAMGTVTAGTTNGLVDTINFTGDSGGTSNVVARAVTVNAQGANAINIMRPFSLSANHSGSNTIANVQSYLNSIAVTSTGSITTAVGVQNL